MKNHLQEQVAHFFGKFRVIAGIERVENFVNFFNQVGAQRGVSLLAVPRTTSGRAKAFLHGDEFFKPLASRQSVGLARFFAGVWTFSCLARSFLSGKASGSPQNLGVAGFPLYGGAAIFDKCGCGACS